MTKPVVSGQGLRLVAMLAMLVVIMAGIKAASPIVVPFFTGNISRHCFKPVGEITRKNKDPPHTGYRFTGNHYCFADGITV